MTVRMNEYGVSKGWIELDEKDWNRGSLARYAATGRTGPAGCTGVGGQARSEDGHPTGSTLSGWYLCKYQYYYY